MIMKKKYSLILTAASVFFLAGACAGVKHAVTGDPSGRTPNAEREFRAAWVATVANVNWPSKPGLPVEQQKKEAIELLDLLYNNNYNAVIFQVRPQCDALYKSDLEPWSYYLTGVQGKAPDPYYDPLEFWITQAHARGIELHAWLNPYRAHHVAGGEVTESSVVKKRPDLVVKLEKGYWWMEPTKQAVQDQTYNVVMDLVRRYDLDGIHFDDYFYPYPSYNNDKDFPDDESWQDYLKSGGRLSRSDWRRESVNTLIKRIYKGIKAEKPQVKFGLSPFGIWRPYNPLSITGFDQHEVLYADARKWLNEGWIDYYSPQLYWQINQMPQSYPLLLGWWKEENSKNRHLWPGISLSIQPVPKLIDETLNQIMVARGMLPRSPGVVHWSIGPVAANPQLAKAIVEGPYKRKALVPPSPWLDKKAPAAPAVNVIVEKDTMKITWSHTDINDIARWVVYFRYGNQWNYDIQGNTVLTEKVPAFLVNKSLLTGTDPSSVMKVQDLLIPLDSIAVSAVDHFGNESSLTFIKAVRVPYSEAPSLEDILNKFSPVDIPFEVEDGYIFVQKEKRRNDSTDWKIVWEDEFDKGSLDTTHWSKIGLYTSERLLKNFPAVKTDKNAWKEIINHWASYMCSTDPEAVKFNEGNILLRGIINSDTTGWDNRPYHTGGIWTLGKFAFQYGRIEVRAKLDPAYGAWPAIWMIPEKAIYKNQHNGELDIMERLNHDDFAYQTIHSHWNLNLKLETPQRFTTAKIDTSDYNVYSLEWYPDKIRFAVNDIISFEYSRIPGAGTFQWPFDQPFYLIIDQQLEGWPGKVTNPDELPIDMTVDWVRLYQ